MNMVILLFVMWSTIMLAVGVLFWQIKNRNAKTDDLLVVSTDGGEENNGEVEEGTLDYENQFNKFVDSLLELHRIDIKKRDELLMHRETENETRLSEIEKKHQVEIDEIKELAKKECDELKTRLENRHKEELNKRDIKYVQLDKKLKESNSQWQEKVDKATSDFKKQIEEKEKSYSKEIKEKDNNYKRELERKDKEQQEIIETLKKNYEEEIEKEKENTLDYRKHLEFALEPRKSLLEYASNAVQVVELIQVVVIKAAEMEREGVFDKEGLSYFFKKSIHKFVQSTNSDKIIQAWRCELTLFADSGLYSLSRQSQLKSVFRGQDSVEKQLANFKYRLHQNFMATYASASLIMLQELCSIDRLGGIAVEKKVLDYFRNSKDQLLELLKILEYDVTMVELFSKYQGSSYVNSVKSLSIETISPDAILEVVKIGIRYNGSKEVTEVIVNRVTN